MGLMEKYSNKKGMLIVAATNIPYRARKTFDQVIRSVINQRGRRSTEHKQPTLGGLLRQPQSLNTGGLRCLNSVLKFHLGTS